MNRLIVNKSLWLILLLAFGLRFASITFDSFWLDEAYTTMFDSFGYPLLNLMGYHGEPVLCKFYNPQPLSAVLSNFRDVDPLCPPLYPIFLNRWMCLFGITDLSIRSMSAVFSTGSVFALYAFASLLFSPALALFAALLQAISPYDLAYGQEARMYSQVALFSTLSFGSLIHLLRCGSGGSRNLPLMAVYILSTWAMVNTHYTALFVWASQILLGIFLAFKRRDAKLFGWLMVSWALVAVVWLPWFEMFLKAADTSKGSFYVDRPKSWWWPVSALFFRVPVNWLTFICGKRVPLYAVPIYATATILIASAMILATKRGQNIWARFGIEHNSEAERFSFNCVVYWCIAPTLLLLLADCVGGRRVIEISRYLIGTAPAIFIMAGRALSVLSRHRNAFVALIVTHAIFCFVVITYMHLVVQQRPWRQMATTVNALVKPDDIVMVSEYYDIVCLDHYLDHPLRQVGLSPTLGAEKIHKLFDTVFPSLDKFWLITSGTGEGVVPMLPGIYRQSSQQNFPHNLHLRLYERNN